MFARGKRALGICDRCGFQYLLNDLKNEIVDQRRTGMLVCTGCMDEDHPQLQLGKFPVYDPQALRNPRPTSNFDRGLFGWNPVGNPANTLTGMVGFASVRT